MHTSKHTHAHTHTHACSLLSLSVPSLILPYQLQKKKRERERESPPSIQFQFTFQFQGALLARLCLSDAKAINKKTGAFKAKRKKKATVALYYGKDYNQNNNNKHWNHFNLPSIPFFCTHRLWGVSAGFSFPLLIVMGHGKCSTKLCKHMWKQRGGSNGRLITANEFLRKWLGLFDCPNVSPLIQHDTWVQRRVMFRVWRM